MGRTRAAVVVATLLVSAGCAGPTSSGDRTADVSPAAEPGHTQALTAPVCAASEEPCEDTLISASDGSCTTNLGRACAEALADRALQRWVADPHGGPDGGGDTELLEILDDDTVVIGYAFGSDLTFTGSHVDDGGDRITVVLTFDQAPRTTTEGEPVFFTLELRVAREIVTLPTPIDRRPIEIAVEIDQGA